MENVEETGERAIGAMKNAFAHELREMQRQGAVGSQETEESLQQAWRLLRIGGFENRDRRRREGQRRLLPEPDGFILRARCGSGSRLVRVQGFEFAQREQEVVVERLFLKLLQVLVGRHRIARPPTRAGHRMISPRAMPRSAVSVKAFTDT